MLVEDRGHLLLVRRELDIESTDVGDQIPAQPDPHPVDLAAGAEVPQQGGGGCSGQRGRGTPGEQLPQQRVELAYDPSSVARQICSSFIEQCENLDGTLRIDRTGITLRRSHTRRCGRIYPVVLASAATGQFTYPSGGGGRDIEDELPEGQQPLGEVVAETVGVLDCPGTLRPRLGPDDQFLVVGAGGVDADRAEIGVGDRVDRGGGVAGLVRIDTDDDHGRRFPSRSGRGIRGEQADFKYLSQQLGVTPLSSHSANADRKAQHTP
ncbi:hypothetical protein EBESD8_54670 [Rhodococcus aetherivorans]|nr:hypothetical protein EBESD8_54670 [Rhodococcus aetherivorans]